MTRSGKAGDLFVGAFDAFDDQRTGEAAQNLWRAETVDVRVIPVEPGRLVLRDVKTILERRIAGLDGSFQDVILVTDCRDGEAVEMEIC